MLCIVCNCLHWQGLFTTIPGGAKYHIYRLSQELLQSLRRVHWSPRESVPAAWPAAWPSRVSVALLAVQLFIAACCFVMIIATFCRQKIGLDDHIIIFSLLTYQVL